MDNNPNPEVKPIIPEVKPEVIPAPVVTPVEEKPPEYNYDDVHKEPIKTIAENKEVPEVKPEVKPEVPVEPPVEPKKEEEEVIEPKTLAKDIATEVTKNLTPEEKKVAKDKYTEFFEKTKEEKGRDPNWIELSKFLEDQAVERMEAKQAETKKAEEDRKIEEDKAKEAFTKRFNTNLDEELEELYKTGALAPIKDKNNPSDQGVIERKALFQAMLDTNAKRTTEGKEIILSIARIYYGGYYTKPKAQPAGEEAPVSLGSGTPAGQEEKEIEYKDVHRPWPHFRQIKS